MSDVGTLAPLEWRSENAVSGASTTCQQWCLCNFLKQLLSKQQAVDPDIDTLPLLAWSTEMASTVGSAAHRGLLRMQHYFFFPILMFARFSWCEQSVTHNLGPKPKKVRNLRVMPPSPCLSARGSFCQCEMSRLICRQW